MACASFPLIFIGGLVTTTRSGMAVPDWPSTYGYNLFLYPWQTWVFGPWKLFVEHGHRLFASMVGLLAILLVVTALRTRAPRGYVIGAIVALLLVCFQGFLGGARVLLETYGVLDGRSVAFLHGVTGPLFFAFAMVYAVAASKRGTSHWATLREEPKLRSIQSGSLLLALFAFVQLVLGACLRHVPDAAEPNYFKIVTLMHLLFAGALLVQLLTVAGGVLSRPIARRALGGSAALLLVLLVAQISLGVMTWVLKYNYPPSFPFAEALATLTIEHQSAMQITTVTAHVANGALILALAARLAFLTRRAAAVSSPIAALLLTESLP